jgi:hypothetical protein
MQCILHKVGSKSLLPSDSGSSRRVVGIHWTSAVGLAGGQEKARLWRDSPAFQMTSAALMRSASLFLAAPSRFSLGIQ